MGHAETNMLWVLVCGALVFLMQAGFLCLESGLTHSKNAINVALKNVTDFSIAFLLFWATGFALSFGTTAGGWIGTDGFLLSLDSDAGLIGRVLFQAMFCATAATIVSGAITGRMRFSAYVVMSVVVSGLLYPTFCHWAWGGAFGGGQGWLASLGFVDFAGSTVVHSVGAWAALAAVLVIGPRRGRFDPKQAKQWQTGSNLPLAMLGTLLLAFGWMGFNGGSAMAFNEHVPRILFSTMLSASAGMVTALGLGWLRSGYADVRMAMNGLLAGLVAITAGCYVLDATSTIVVGSVAAFVMAAVDRWLIRRQIDDAVGVIPVHAGAGVWGTIAVGLFADPRLLGTGLSRGTQVLVQILGVGVAFAVAFGGSYVLFRLLNCVCRLRVTAEEEDIGLNIAEHGASTEVFELLCQMESHRLTGDVSTRIEAQVGTEVGQISAQYNRVLDRLETEHESVMEANRQLHEGAAKILMSQTRLQAILDSTVDPMIATDPQGIICLASRSVEVVFGWTSEELLGQNVNVLMADPQREHDEALAESPVSEEGESLPGTPRDLHAVRRDGEVFPCTVTVWRTTSPSLSDSLHVRIIRDITKEKAAELALEEKDSQLQQSQRLKSLGALAGGVAHEFNNLLQAISGFTNFAIDELPADSQPREDLQHVLVATDRAAYLTRQLLGFSRRDTLERQNIQPNECIDELTRMLRPLLGAQIEVVVSLDDMVSRVNADPTMLQQILMNLCINARDAMPSGGQLTVSTSSVTVTDENCDCFPDLEPGQFVRFAVADTGTGMTEEVQQRIFEPFFSTKEVGKGTGLGMSMVHGQVHQHGGGISVYSEIGNGTTFKIYLPATDAIASGSTAQIGVESHEGTEVILIAEDEPCVREPAIRVLQRAGYTTLVAEDGEQAVELFRAHADEISLLVFDVMMPKMTGREAYQEICRTRPDTPVIFCTGYDPKSSSLDFDETENRRLIQKPFNPNELLSAVRELLDESDVPFAFAESPTGELLTVHYRREQLDCLTASRRRASFLGMTRTPPARG